MKMTPANRHTHILPGEVGLTLSLRTCQSQNDKKAHSPHPVIHPAVLPD